MLVRTNKEESQRRKDHLNEQLSLRRVALDKSSDKKRVLRRIHLERLEAIEEEKYLRAQESYEANIRQAELLEKLAHELLRRKNEERQFEAENPIRSIIRIRDCVAVKTREELIKKSILFEANQAALINKWYTDGSTQAQEAKEIKEKRDNYLKDLKTQLATNRLESERNHAEERKQEWLIIEAATLAEEAKKTAEKNQKEENIIRLHDEQEEFLKLREITKEKERLKLEEEEEKINRIKAQKEEEERKRQEQKSDLTATKEAIMERISKKLLDLQCQRIERDEILLESLLQDQRTQMYLEEKKLALQKIETTKRFVAEIQAQERAIAKHKENEKILDMEMNNNLNEHRRKCQEKADIEAELRHQRNRKYGEDLQNAIIEGKIEHVQKILTRQETITGKPRGGQLCLSSLNTCNHETCVNKT